MMKRVLLSVSIFLIALTAAASFIETYRVRLSESSAQLLWRDDEAFLFIGTSQLGWRLSYGKLVLSVFAPFGVAPQNSKKWITVFRISPTGLERHVVDNMEMPLFGIVDAHIISTDGRWANDHFEPATPDEARRLSTPIEFSNEGGWSKRSVSPMSTPPEGWKLAFELRGEPIVLTVSSHLLVSVAIDLQRGNHQPERLWSLDQRSRSVSKAEYEALFGK